VNNQEKLREKNHELGKKVDFFKNKYTVSTWENFGLAIKVEELKEELHVSNARIVDLVKEKGVVEAPTNFSSRFMPSVKFCVMGEKRKLMENALIGTFNFNYLRTNSEGVLWDGCDYQGNFDEWINQKEVSLYEAIPELVPKGMVYDKESDSLIQKTCDNQMCAGEVCACEPKISSPIEESVELAGILEKLQVFLWNTNLPILQGVEFTFSFDEEDKMKKNHTISFTTIDMKKS